MSEATPTHVIQTLLTLAVVEPSVGCCQYADRPRDQGFAIAMSAVQEHLVTHRLGRRSQRLARAPVNTAATTGLVTEAAPPINPARRRSNAGDRQFTRGPNGRFQHQLWHLSRRHRYQENGATLREVANLSAGLKVAQGRRQLPWRAPGAAIPTIGAFR